MIKYSGINHVAIATSDMNRTLRFWRDLLGMRLIASMGRPGQCQYFLEVSGSSVITFFEWDGVEPLDEKDPGYPVKGKFGLDHVAFGVEAEEDLCELKGRLSAAGFWVSEIIDHGFLRSLYSFDPNGIAIEFTCEVPGADVRSRPVLKARNPGEAAQQGSDPMPGQWPEATPLSPDECLVYPGEGRDEFGQNG